MPKTPTNYLRVAKDNLTSPPYGTTHEQMAGRMAGAQAAALIELAEQQQTANLIAYMQAAYRGGLAYRPSPEVLKSVQADVEERLGLA
jgi:hypothetical protein